MALAITNRGSGTHNTGAASFGLAPASNFNAGPRAMAVLFVAADNSASGGSSNDITGVTDTKGNTWTKRRGPVFDNGAASAGVQGAVFTTSQNGGALTTGDTITVSFGSSPVAKAWTLTEVQAAANAEPAYVTGGDKSAGATGTALTLGASGSIPSGDAILAGFFIEAGTTQSLSAADSDATNGSWSTNQYAEIGSTTSGSVIVTQGKVVTGTGTQTYDVTLGISSDYHGSWIQLHEQHVVAASQTATGGGVAVAAGVKNGKATVTASGGGVETQTARKDTSAAQTVTGGGVATAVSSAAHAGSVAGTGGGNATASPVAGRQAAIGATASGSSVAAALAGRQAAATGTGGGILAYSYDAEFAEAHDGTATATGGGTITLTAVAARAAVVSAAGAGIAASSGAAARQGTAAATGAGAAVTVASSARASGAAATGGGSASASAEAARLAAALMSGGGVLTSAGLTARLGIGGGTGGGVAQMAYSLGESHDGVLIATGGGAAAIAALAVRLAAIAATGSGAAAIAWQGAHAGSLAGSGGGGATVTGGLLRRGSAISPGDLRGGRRLPESWAELAGFEREVS